MPITERGRIVTGRLDERGRFVFNGLTETGQKVFTITGTNPTTVPVVTIISISKSKISAVQDGSNYSVVTFKFDVDVTAWEVRVAGAGNGTGTLADSGGAVPANTEITATVDNTEGIVQGYNKANIYGQNVIGWTPFESDPNAPKNYYLQLDGIDDYLNTPTIAGITDIYMDVELNDDAGTLWNARNGNDKPEIKWDGTKFTSTNGTSHITTSETGSTDPAYNLAVTKNKKVTIHTWETTAWITSSYNFGRTGWSNSNYLNMKVYSIKLYAGATLKAYYDMSTGNVNDQSGNGNHATLTGGTWVVA
jgi:hypothetical protein